MIRRIAILLIAAFACVGCDQSAKAVARHYLDPGERISLLGDTLRLSLIENPGAFLSVGDALPRGVRDILFLGIVPSMLVAFAVFLAFSKGIRVDRVFAAGLFIGGGLGNLIDRATNEGRVYDFLNVGMGAVRTGIFNIADAILIFAVIYLVFTRDESTRSTR